MNIFKQTLTGIKHEKNEDSLFISNNLKSKTENYKLIMIMDGISSYGNSSIFTNKCKEYLENLNEKKLFELTKEIFDLENMKIISRFNHIGLECNSGSTLSLVIIEQNNKIVKTFNFGDSPIYLIGKNMFLPVYGDCSYPVYKQRDYTKIQRLRIGEKLFFLIKPYEEIKFLRKANHNPENCNVVMSALPYKLDIQHAHFFPFKYQENDILLMGTDGFLSSYIYPNFEQTYISMANQIKAGGQPILDKFIKLNSSITSDDATGICIVL